VRKSNIIFQKPGGLLHGGDYNPDQWLDRPDILQEDIRLMKKAGINTVTLGVFAWSAYEKEEGIYTFDWLESIMDDLYKNGIYTVLATPSAARPAWLDAKYPDAMRTDDSGVRIHHGVRHNHCMSSLNFREKVGQIDKRLAERFAHHPGLIMWHISNELQGSCYCDQCISRFRKYLAAKYDNDIEKLNKAWWTSFWSHTFNDFDQIEPPFRNGEFSILGLKLEWRRFSTWNMTDFMKYEIDILKPYNSEIPFTTNFMEMFEDYDYFEMAKELDVVSWDSYPMLHQDEKSFSSLFYDNAFNHALFRSLKKGVPFMMMESAPGIISWAPVNKYRKPGVHELLSLQAVAAGSDTVQYFQIRKSRGNVEQFMGGVIDHVGTDETRIYKEVAALGTNLKKLSEITGSLQDNKVAVLFDWDTRWAIKDVQALSDATKQYDRTVMDFWIQLAKMGAEPDIISQDEDWSDYKVVIAPMPYLLHDGTGEKIKHFVENGGQLLTTYLAGYVDKDTLCYLGGFPGQGLSEVFGIISEEIDSLYPTERNEISLTSSGKCLEVKDYAELIRVKDAETLARYTKDYQTGEAAITVKQYGKGKAYYVACRLKQEDMVFLYQQMLQEAGIGYELLPDNLEKHVRYSEDYKYEFYLNVSEDSRVLEGVKGYEMLSEKEIDGILTLQKYQVAVIKNGK